MVPILSHEGSRPKMIYIGLDVHQKRTTIAWLDAETGEICPKPWSVPTGEIAAELERLPGRKVAVMEAGSVSHFVSRQLESCDVELAVVDTVKAHRRIEGINTAKTDRLDAIALARLMSWGHLNDAVVWEPDEATYELRLITRARHKLSRINVMVRCMIRQLIARYAKSCPQTDLTGNAAGEWLDEFGDSLPDDIGEVFGAYRELLEFLKVLMARMRKSIAQTTKENESVDRVRTIPGIGAQLAPIIVAEIGDIHRFESALNLRGYSGLVPKVSQSGQRTRIGRLIRGGNRHLRRAMVQAAELFKQSKATNGTRLKKWYWSQLARHGPNPARVALARKLLTIIHAMLRDGTDFDPALHAVSPAD